MLAGSKVGNARFPRVHAYPQGPGQTSPVVVDVCLRGFPHAERILDLGGGHGEHAREFARRGRRPTVQDLTRVVDEARTRNDLQEEGVELFAGDLATTLAPGPFDLVFCSTVTNMAAADGRQPGRRCGDRQLHARPRPGVGGLRAPDAGVDRRR
ncbi:class I SAM-dependent methyltransferase [Lipingzhangella halophila]|uniref:class I SAM-dependent methyltransferase n=1 Tax=Lipingzhangella halophila TaxID=1783352 RepID=UPI0035E45A57